MIEYLIQQLLTYWPVVLAFGISVYLSKCYINGGLYKYPGPFLAHFTDLWRFTDVLKRRPDITQLNLHRKHGDVVRLGPNMLSFGSPRALKTIYGLNKGFTKSDFYPVQQAVSNGKRLPSLFSTTDESYHANLRRCVNNAFSMSALKDYEPLVNETVQLFLDQTDKLYAQTNKICDFALWLQYFAFDVIGHVTYSKPHGFIDRAEDVDGMVAYLGRLFGYVGPIGQMPWLDLLVLKNPILLFLDRLGFRPLAFPITTFAKARMAEHQTLDGPQEKKPPGATTTAIPRADLLSQFLKAQSDKPDFMTSERVLTMAVSMAFAGSETTAISLAAVFYHLLRTDNSRCLHKLLDELTAARADGRLDPLSSSSPSPSSSPHLVSWSQSQTLPYLDACIKEAFRLHPAAGLPLERITPPSGIEIDGHLVPGGVIVGCNAWVIHKTVEVFCPDGQSDRYPVDEYVPERWIDASAEQLREMNGTMFQFGMGARTCIGKNISLLEMYKLVPAFLSRFEIEFAGTGSENEWTLYNAWFVKQFGFNVRFRRREYPAENIS